jgi:hypothetical protein
MLFSIFFAESYFISEIENILMVISSFLLLLAHLIISNANFLFQKLSLLIIFNLSNIIVAYFEKKLVFGFFHNYLVFIRIYLSLTSIVSF